MSYTVYRRDANTAAPSSVTRLVASASATASSTHTLTPRMSGWGSPVTGTSSSNYNNQSQSQSPYDYNSSAFTTSWITYLAIIVCAGVLVALISSRYFYIRRYYQRPTLRAYFVPQHGIHFLGVHVKGPPGRTIVPMMTSLDEVYGASAGQRGERRRRRRRNRQTVGDTLGPGGTRIGDGDDDDGWDYDDADLEAAAVAGTGGGGRGERGELPQYQADSGLPAYAAPASSSTLTPTTTAEGVLPSAAEYEAQSRGNRDGLAPPAGVSLSSSAGAGLPTYPPLAHVHGASRYPSEPPPSFSRANSGVSTMTRSTRLPPPVGHDHDANDSRSTFDGTDPDPIVTTDGDARRRESTATTASSSASKLGRTDDDEDDLDGDSVKSAAGATPSSTKNARVVASGSKVTLGSSSSSSASGDSDHEKPPNQDREK
ncbi:hypothetical protein JCM11491_004147 [Sporobolomyces phaffii]